ncbi:hypothetical protein LO762_09450 [Actinocorallia sp. API 0066]|uniref:hypothetical protein n=1 Tax=Actinocorallia sp. API 0066 TaxID=2896846 RepID=UPI001E53C200|nr:hypothetical protein [Actinocorallia sp. API 0066]MCD0449412.1 hypothetical protein [Actinocorallia sp. API 0066]
MTPKPSAAALVATGLQTLRADQERARRTINLVAAESLMPQVARLPLICDAAARYMFESEADDRAAWNFPGGRDTAWLETGLAVPLLRGLLGVDHVTVRPLSGLHAMEMTIGALAPPGSTVACLDAESGGHYATAAVARRLGHPIVGLPTAGPHRLDVEAAADLCRRN